MSEEQETKQVNKKKFYKQWWFWVIIILVITIGYSSDKSKNTGTNQTASSSSIDQSEVKTNSTEKAVAPVANEPKIPTEYKSALKQANTYANTMHMSKIGIYEQLISEYGGQFTAEAAQYGTDNVKADWNANALAEAKTYQDSMHMSPAAIRSQLVSEYGGKFTSSEADYAMQNLGS